MSELVTADRRMNELIQLAKTVAQSKATVLIQGDSGTGKEVMAGIILANSSRANRPFVAINCAAIPENLLESELFGYERGAFTGAVNSKAGKFELANTGTILLDEISEMDIRLQAKLLRVIQEGQVDRIGGSKPIPVDIRILATTNKNLASCVKDGSFREDLFYRINVVNLTLPKLKERIGDVRLLAEHFLKEFSRKNQKPVQGFAPEAVQKLESHGWPGNVRELENVLERALITCTSAVVKDQDITIEQEKPWLEANHVVEAWTPGQTLEQIEKNVILEALKHHHGNRTHTAKALGISIRTLRNKLADYRKIGIFA